MPSDADQARARQQAAPPSLTIDRSSVGVDGPPVQAADVPGGGDRGLDRWQMVSILVEKIVALQLCREAMRDQKDVIKMGRYVIEKERHEEH